MSRAVSAIGYPSIMKDFLNKLGLTFSKLFQKKPQTTISPEDMAKRILFVSIDDITQVTESYNRTDQDLLIRSLYEYSFFCVSELTEARIPWINESYTAQLVIELQSYFIRMANQGLIEIHEASVFHLYYTLRRDHYRNIDTEYRVRRLCIHLAQRFPSYETPTTLYPKWLPKAQTVVSRILALPPETLESATDLVCQKLLTY